MDVLRGRDTFSQREMEKPEWRHLQEVVTVESDALTALTSVHVSISQRINLCLSRADLKFFFQTSKK